MSETKLTIFFQKSAFFQPSTSASENLVIIFGTPFYQLLLSSKSPDHLSILPPKIYLESFNFSPVLQSPPNNDLPSSRTWNTDCLLTGPLRSILPPFNIFYKMWPGGIILKLNVTMSFCCLNHSAMPLQAWDRGQNSGTGSIIFYISDLPQPWFPPLPPHSHRLISRAYTWLLKCLLLCLLDQSHILSFLPDILFPCFLI